MASSTEEGGLLQGMEHLLDVVQELSMARSLERVMEIVRPRPASLRVRTVRPLCFATETSASTPTRRR